MALATLALGATLDCKATPAPPPPPEPHHPPSDAALTEMAPPPESSEHAAPAKPPAPAPRPKPGPTAEQLAQEAKGKVEEAVKLAAGKEPCGEILPLLDGSYALARTAVAVDEPTLAVFASCAVHGQRWHLLRDLADSIAAGERKLETTYFLPRALVGEADYEQAHTLSKATLRAWPTEGDAYNAAALAALRVKDWDGAMKAADQALLLLRKHNVNNEVTAMAHGLRGAALLRLGKTEEGVHEVDGAKDHEKVLSVTDITLDAAHVAKQTGLLVSIDSPKVAYPALWSLYVKKRAPVSGLVTVGLQNLTDRPMQVIVEVSLTGAETATESETVHKGKPVTLVITPEWKTPSALVPAKAAESHELTVTITGATDHGALYHQTHKVMFEPADAMPKVLRAHGEDLRSAFPLEAAWITPAAPAITEVVDAAKARVRTPGKQFEGAAGLSLPQAQALWDELRGRNVAFRRDPGIDHESTESTPCQSPTEILASGRGNALESSVLFASLLEAIGLDVVLVRTPGHRMVGWLATAADLAAGDAAGKTVKTVRGQGFFLETTTVGDGPFDAAVLRGDAEWVAATNDGSLVSGRAQLESLKELRQWGIAPRVEASAPGARVPADRPDPHDAGDAGK